MKNIEQQTIHINQLLHGYDEGHRLLAGSIKPDRQSAKTLLALSDLSGQGVSPGPSGYITGYPLPQMSAYAIARTWLAPEMPRPGCVWTHTLLIDFSDLAVISNVALLNLFLRPSNREDISSYGQVLTTETSIAKSVHRSLPFSTMLALLEAVYEFPKDCIFVKTQEDLPASVSAPYLHRNFRKGLSWSPEIASVATANVQCFGGSGNDAGISIQCPTLPPRFLPRIFLFCGLN